MSASRDAGSLRCPGCGASVGPESGRCPYCRARLATIGCPSCYALMFDTAAHCQNCGAPRRRADREGAALSCPACRVPMEHASVGATALLECRSCDGVWVDAAEFERICASSEAQAAVLHHLIPQPGVRPAVISYRPCPRCEVIMNRINFGRVSGTVVDACRGHGTFLDAGELHAIVTFIRGGGLERARARQLEDLKEAEQRLELKRTRLMRPQSDRGWTFDAGRDASAGVLKLIDFLNDR